MKDLKQRTIRGGFARICSQGANAFIRVGSLMVLARLLVPADFGLVGMATAFTGLLNLLRDFGLSAAAVQRATVSDEQHSTLFWVNLSAGAVLALLAVASAPAVADFYQQPRLAAVMAVLGIGFLFNAAGTQHGALLQRQMRFTTMSIIGVVAAVLSAGIAIGGAMAGFGYWALVAMYITLPLFGTLGYWLTAHWIPGLPRRRVGVRSMIGFGGILTLDGLVAYIGFNIEKVLLGRYWGAEALGIYGRSYQLVNMPTSNLNSAAGEVAFAALSRLQDDRKRLRNYFLKGYSLVLALAIPLTITCALFPRDLILVFLGPRWNAAVPVLRLLSPLIFFFGITNPLGWLMFSTGLVKRGLKIALVLTPLVIVGYIVGLPYGPSGVASGYSATLLLLALPLAAWSVHHTGVSFRDVLLTISKPLASGVVGGGVAFFVVNMYGHLLSPLPRLLMEVTVLFLIHSLLLLFVANQKSLYMELLRGLAGTSAVDGKWPSLKNASRIFDF